VADAADARARRLGLISGSERHNRMRDRIAAGAIALAVQAAFGWWLFNFIPVLQFPPLTDDALQVVFVEPVAAPAPARPVEPAATGAPSVPEPPALGDARDARSPSGQDAGTDVARARPGAPLDLSLPDEMTVVQIGTPDPFDRPPVLDAKSTRFARHWKPQADAITELSWEHPMLGAALHVFGGPPPPECSEENRRRGRRDCRPLLLRELHDETANFNIARPELYRPSAGIP
jgi:hypothetical protein